MLSKNKIKFIRSLEMKKFRSETNCFLAEGNKLVADLLPYFDCTLLVARPTWMACQGDISADELYQAEEDEIRRASLLKSPQDVIAVFRQPDYNLDNQVFSNELCLALDGVQDPGNLGTIVRLADWFGIRTVVCSPDSVDIFNPKTVQATMGSIARVGVYYQNLPQLFDSLDDTVPIYGTFLDGKNIYSETLSPTGLIVMGSEGRGISPEVEARISRRLFIPNFSADGQSGESLNVSVAAAVVCSEFRRRR